MIRADLVVDVSDSCQLGRPLHIVATVFLPPREELAPQPAVVFALPGGGYSRGYFDMHFPGHAGYSQAEHHVDRGLVLVALDHLGVGDSTPEVAGGVRIDDIAAANDFAVRTITDRLRSGTAVEGYPALAVGARIGIGQSMGGCVTVIMAGRHRTYDAIGVLGYSSIHTVLPMREHDETVRASEYFDYSRDTAPDDLSIAESAAHIGEFLYPFHYEDVPADIVEADIGGGYPIRTTAPLFGSKTLPNCVVAMLSPGYTAAEAAAVDVPVFIGLGERDTAPHPHREPSAYPNSTDVSLLVCDRMAHMHNFATTRHKLWDRLAHWYTAVAGERSVGLAFRSQTPDLLSNNKFIDSTAATKLQPTHIRQKWE
jgi:pimeloyl-ACP methyl ester carboxylesterase